MRRGHRRDDVGGAHQAVDDERLAADLGDVPAGHRRHPARKVMPRTATAAPRGSRSASPAARAGTATSRPSWSASISMPMPTMIAEARRTPAATGGCAIAELVQALDLAVGVVRQDQAAEPAAPRSRSGSLRLSASGIANSSSGAPRSVSQTPSIAAIFAAGAPACSGRAGRRRRSAAGSAPRRPSGRRAAPAAPSVPATPRSSCQARQAASRNATVSPDASSMCVRR